ncbi:uncharacterized protein LOC120884170 [Ictidomys tridecemlineatus]
MKSPSPAGVQQWPSCLPYPGLSLFDIIVRSNVLLFPEMPGGEFGPIKARTPFSLQYLRQIKTDLGRFSEDPDKYIEVFQNLCQVFDFTWKDIMLLLNQTLTSNEKEAALRAAEQFGDDLYLAHAPAAQTRSKPNYPSGAQAVPRNDPDWDPNDKQDAWKIRHFQMLVLEALRRIKQKPVNYSKVSEIIQGPQESPAIFMEKLREAMRKHTTVDPESIEGQLLLKDKFITQSAPDIRRKLQKWAYGPDQSLDDILRLATSIFYNRDLEEKKEKERRDRKRTETLVSSLRGVSSQGEKGGRNAPQSTKGTCFHCGEGGHFKRDCPRAKLPPPKPCPKCQGNHWRSDCPQGRRSSKPDSSTQA